MLKCDFEGSLQDHIVKFCASHIFLSNTGIHIQCHMEVLGYLLPPNGYCLLVRTVDVKTICCLSGERRKESFKIEYSKRRRTTYIPHQSPCKLLNIQRTASA